MKHHCIGSDNLMGTANPLNSFISQVESFQDAKELKAKETRKAKSAWRCHLPCELAGIRVRQPPEIF
jgi:hypothetical protein